MPCPFTGPKMFWAGPIFLCPTKNYLHIVAVTNILCQTKRQFEFSKISFYVSRKFFGEEMQSHFLGWLKMFGPAQKFLGPVKGQGNHSQDSFRTFFLEVLAKVSLLRFNHLYHCCQSRIVEFSNNSTYHK